MTTDIKLAKSRPLGVAENLLKTSIDEKLVYSKIVVLTGQAEILSTPNGKWCFLDSLKLLSRIVGNLKVIIPFDNFELFAEISTFVQDAWRNGQIELIDGDYADTPSLCDAVLSIGTQQNTSLPWTVINSNGWVARISSDSNALPCDVDQANPIAALMAASLGVTEIFKRIFSVPDEIAPLISKTEFSLFDLTEYTDSLGPELPTVISLPDTLLVGAGAIGNGTALLMSQLPLEGRVYVVDKQDYADENLGTCILINQDWLKKPKAEQLGLWLEQSSNLKIRSKKTEIESIGFELLDSDLAINLILNGLDHVDARRAAQDIWPEVIIDGGINEVGAAVVRYQLASENLACLKCWFDIPKKNEHDQQSIWTGLNVNNLNDIGRQLIDEDIESARDDKKAWLTQQKKDGKTICSIISEAALANKLGVEVTKGFRPSVPFVATAASALVVAEAIKAIAFPEASITPKFQIANLFLGLAEDSTIKLNMKPLNSCQCVKHRDLILQIKNKRSKKSAS